MKCPIYSDEDKRLLEKELPENFLGIAGFTWYVKCIPDYKRAGDYTAVVSWAFHHDGAEYGDSLAIEGGELTAEVFKKAREAATRDYDKAKELQNA